MLPVPAFRVAALVETWLEGQNNRSEAVLDLARESGVRVRTVKALVAGRLDVLDFTDADRIVTRIDPFAWLEELEDVYPAAAEMAAVAATLGRAA